MLNLYRIRYSEPPFDCLGSITVLAKDIPEALDLIKEQLNHPDCKEISYGDGVDSQIIEITLIHQDLKGVIETNVLYG